MKRVFTNPWWGVLLFLAIFWITTIVCLTAKPVKKLIINTFTKEQKTEINKNKRELNKKMHLSKGHYFSADYSVSVNDEEKIITTVGIVCVLGNGNVIHITTTGENVDGRIKETEETVDFIIKHQDEIFDELIRAIVEAGQRHQEPKIEKPLQNNKSIKKKV